MEYVYLGRENCQCLLQSYVANRFQLLAGKLVCITNLIHCHEFQFKRSQIVKGMNLNVSAKWKLAITEKKVNKKKKNNVGPGPGRPVKTKQINITKPK